MKIRFYLALAAAALVMTNCSQDEELVQVKQPTKGFTATIEGASRSNATEAGVFTWTAGDKISVWNGSTFDVYANSTEDINTFNPQGNADIADAADYAIYPAGGHSISGQDVTINLPATYEYGSTNAPMLATITAGSSTLAFKHLGGLMRFVVKNVPAEASSFVFTTETEILTGNYNVVDGQIRQNGAGSVNNNNSVTISFDESDIQNEMVFFVPLPVGTYGEYTVEIKGDNLQPQYYTHTSTGVSNTIGRRTLLLMPEFFVENGELKKGAGNVIPVTQNEAANLSGIQNVTIGTGAPSDELDINYTPSEGNATLNIKENSNATESQDSKGKIKINPQGSEAIESLNLNTPSLTAELGAGTYKKVEALTANQTLIIGEGVTIETLVLNGGALQVAEGATTSTIENIVVKDAASFIEALKVAENITLADDVTEINLNLTTGSFLTIGEGKEVSIDLNGKTLTTSTVSDSNIPDDITVKGSLVVKNGNVNTANTAFFANGGTLTLTDCNVTTSSTYGATAVMVSGAAGNLNISGGSYTGQGADIHDRYVIGVIGGSSATIKTTVSGGNGGVSVIGASTANLTGGSYSGVKACGLYVAGGSTVTYSNCTFSGVEGDVVVGGGSYGNGTVNGTQYTEYTKIKLISTPEELKSILSEGGNVTLASDIDLNLSTGSFLTIGEGKEVSIDLNGKTLTTSTVSDSNIPDDITVKGSLVVKNGNVNTANTAFFANDGTLTLTNCNVTTSSTYGATAVMVSGAAGNLNISGGSYTGQGADIHDRYVIGVIGGSSATINTTVSGGNGGVSVIGASTATLTGGSYSGVKACGLYVAGGSTVTYSDNCTFSGVEGNVVVGGDTYGNGTVNGTTYTVYTKIQ